MFPKPILLPRSSWNDSPNGKSPDLLLGRRQTDWSDTACIMKLEEVEDRNRNKEKQGFSSLRGIWWQVQGPLEAHQCWPCQAHAIVRTRMLLDKFPRTDAGVLSHMQPKIGTQEKGTLQFAAVGSAVLG
jgi:hypothetical protein